MSYRDKPQWTTNRFNVLGGLDEESGGERAKSIKNLSKNAVCGEKNNAANLGSDEKIKIIQEKNNGLDSKKNAAPEIQYNKLQQQPSSVNPHLQQSTINQQQSKEINNNNIKPLEEDITSTSATRLSAGSGKGSHRFIHKDSEENLKWLNFNYANKWKKSYAKSQYRFTPEQIILQKDPPFDFDGKNVYLYSDGSWKNGNEGGICSYFGDHHPLNCSLNITPCPSPFHSETTSILTGLHRLRLWSMYNGEHIIVRTDCLNVILGLMNPTQKCLATHPTTGEKIERDWQQDEIDILENLTYLAGLFPRGVTFQWVKSSDSNNPANTWADQQAKYGRDPVKPPFRKSLEAKDYSDWTVHKHQIKISPSNKPQDQWKKSTPSARPDITYPKENTMIQTVLRDKYEAFEPLPYCSS